MIKSTMNTKLDFSDCELLALFQKHGSLTALAETINMDKGFLSKKISQISKKASVLIKVDNKWQLTRQGEEIVVWFLKCSEQQKLILNDKKELIIGTTQNASERILTPLITKILQRTGFKRVKMLTHINNVESLVLGGQIDLAFVCALPNSPEIRYKKVFKSPYVLCAPFSWGEQKTISLQDLFNKPYVSHSQIDLRNILNLEQTIPHPIAQFDHMAGVRQGVTDGLGWSILPEYTVSREIKSKQIRLLNFSINSNQYEEFQIWYIPTKTDKKKMTAFADLLK